MRKMCLGIEHGLVVVVYPTLGKEKGMLRCPVAVVVIGHASFVFIIYFSQIWVFLKRDRLHQFWI